MCGNVHCSMNGTGLGPEKRESSAILRRNGSLNARSRKPGPANIDGLARRSVNTAMTSNARARAIRLAMLIPEFRYQQISTAMKTGGSSETAVGLQANAAPSEAPARIADRQLAVCTKLMSPRPNRAEKNTRGLSTVKKFDCCIASGTVEYNREPRMAARHPASR